MPILVVDVGTSGIRTAIVDDDLAVTDVRHAELLPSSPADGLVELDAAELAASTLGLARSALADHPPVDGVAITNQRATTVVWDADTGAPVGPALGWQDLRTVGRCLELRGDGIRLAPNQTATKIEWLVVNHAPDGARRLCAGTLDSWLAWSLSGGSLHVTDATNAGVTGMCDPAVTAWDEAVIDALGLSDVALPTIVDSASQLGVASALPGAPPIVALVGDQQSSLVGQGCVEPGSAKITFGTGGMLDLNTGTQAPQHAVRNPAGTFPIVAWRHGRSTVWGVEAVMLAAGANVEWLRDGLGLIGSVGESHDVASACDDTGGVTFVPALLGLGTPFWDFGARGTFVGITRGSGRAELVRAVLEGIAHRGADLVEAAEADTGTTIPMLRIDGGMSRNPTFVQALADASERPVAVSAEVEATTLGAGLLGGLTTGVVAGIDAIGERWRPQRSVDPSGRPAHRVRWRDAVARARRWHEGLSGIDF
jgi:glycerol kinase